MTWWAILDPIACLGQEALTDTRKLQIVYDMYANYRKDFSTVDEISPREASGLLKSDQKVVFVDTRQPEERAVSMLPHAISKQTFLNSRDQYDGYTIIGYCTISYRSGLFARDMSREGVVIYNLKGGILAWTLEGGKVYDTGGVTQRIHVYDKRWDYAPAGYETITFTFWQRLF
jgi:sodium/bile acid cotransporter 7